MNLVYQQGPTGAELGTLGHMATIRLEKKILLYQQGPSNKKSPARQKETPDITQRPLVTIHKHLGTPARVVCCGPLHWVKSLETPEKARTVRQHPQAMSTMGRKKAKGGQPVPRKS